MTTKGDVSFDKLRGRVIECFVDIGRDVSENMRQDSQRSRLNVLLCDVVEYRMKLNTLIYENDVSRRQLTNSTVGLVGGGFITGLIIVSMGSLLPLPLLISSVCLIPFGGCVGYISARPLLQDSLLYETLDKASVYIVYIKLLLRLLDVSSGTDEKIIEVCDVVSML